jgi:hypothetical protein
MKRVWVLGLLLFATSPSGPVATQSAQGWLVQSEPLTDKVSVGVASQPERISVRLTRGATPEGTPLSESALQVWVLTSAGGALRLRDLARPNLTVGTTSNGWTDWRTVFHSSRSTERLSRPSS